ncbi:MAG: hypothetical protein P8H03_04180, partial [Emcibacteraceae bacterium]|nr:hypothetical protein [Emcibacteraceae bacterium]
EIEDEFRLLSNFKALRFSLITSYYDKFTSYLMHCNDKKDTAVTFTNVKRCPLAIVDLVDGLNVIIRKHKTIPDTVINFGGPNFLSRSEMAENCKNYYLPELSLKHSEAAATFFQSRAKSININSNRLEEILNRSLTSNELFFGRLKRKNIR